MELGHFDKHSPLTRERKTQQGEDLRVFCLETLKNFILNDKFYLKMTKIRAFFIQIRALFSIFQKRAGDTFPPPPSSYAPVFTPYNLMSTMKALISLTENINKYLDKRNITSDIFITQNAESFRYC